MGGPFGGGRSSKYFLRASVLGVGRTIFAALFLFFVTMLTPYFTRNNSSPVKSIPFLVLSVCCDTIAIEKRKNFAFETNFRSESLMKLVEQFQEAGYVTNLFFIGLSSIEPV